MSGLVSGLDGNCVRCGRKLKDIKSIERGFGKTCYKKYLKETEERMKKNQISVFDLRGLKNDR
ncbi:hypothetical protein BVF91_09655 [Thermoanaerobacterium sp. PSU-2]|uniref:DUF6011 domain-containing protein n=1 Tax=Thermoanaerobacterium sp. PSU-2 TaxID=1930849 RepID=UPI000A1617C9|nr:DUF6011 domain-containing protein [Thermoanaerobacterium sp. PSU-2]ORX22734.1 hypothetical protein BVF91_09655 [Thermoanaerobacterium sp. PSU-2]